MIGLRSIIDSKVPCHIKCHMIQQIAIKRQCSEKCKASITEYMCKVQETVTMCHEIVGLITSINDGGAPDDGNIDGDSDYRGLGDAHQDLLQHCIDPVMDNDSDPNGCTDSDGARTEPSIVVNDVDAVNDRMNQIGRAHV